MAAEQIEIRRARLEGAYEQINERLSEIRAEVLSLRGELHSAESAVLLALTFILVASLLVPNLRDISR